MGTLKSNLILAVVAMVAVFLIVQPAVAAKGPPERLRCSVSGYESPHDLKYLQEVVDRVCGPDSTDACNINEYLAGHGKLVSIVSNLVVECKTASGTISDVCVAPSDQRTTVLHPQVDFRYFFNSQIGALNMQDKVTKVEYRMSWLNQHDVTKTGYLHATLRVKDVRGGLLGNARLYELEANCYAANSDFPKP